MTENGDPSGGRDEAVSGRSPYAVTLDALEHEAHVPAEDRVEEVAAEPSDAGVWDGELYRRQHDALRAGG